MQRFTQSTIVESRMTVRRERVLPAAGDVVARVRQEVSPRQVVARMPQRMDFHILSVSEKLRIPAAELSRHLLVEEGETVEVGTPLVGKRGIFSKPLYSPVEGVVYRARNGRIVLQRTPAWIDLPAMMRGRVISLLPRRGVVIEADGSLIQAVWSSDKEGYGSLTVLSDSVDAPLNVTQLSDDTSERVVAACRINQVDILRAAAKSGVSGLIVGSMPAEACQVALTLPFPVIITDGIGRQGMALPILELLREAEGRDAALFGRVAGDSHHRPEIIITLSTTPKIASPPPVDPIKPGRKVRILRSPYSSQTGEVVRLYNNKQTTAFGAKAYGADVKLSDGQVVFAPYANLDGIFY